MGDRLTVGQRTLTPPVLVRIQVPQPLLFLIDRGQVINPEMAAGKYAPPVSGGTNLRSAARDLHFNGNIPSAEAEGLRGLHVDHQLVLGGACTGKWAGFSPLRMRSA